jgi:hypothetical protein
MSAQTSTPSSLQLVKETAIERGESEDMIFTAEEWDQFDQHFKRRLAGAANTDEISGRSTMLELRSYFVRQTTLGQYDG